MDFSEKQIVEKITKIRQAYTNPEADLITLKPFAKEVGVTEEEWVEVLDLFHSHLERGIGYMKHQNWDDAIEELDIAFQLDPAHLNTVINLATAHQSRWWKKRRSADKKAGIRYGELCLEIDPKNKAAAGIVTDLKQAPFEFWIRPAMQWKIAKYTFWLLVFGGLTWYYMNNTQQIHTWIKSIANQKTENNSKINLKETYTLKTVVFSLGSIALTESAKPELDMWVAKLKANPKLTIEILGHTDNTGIPTQNLQISRLRAKAVYDYFIFKGIDANKLKYEGLGDTKPIATNETEEGRNINRRIEFIVSTL